jgi:hypothetical protein
MALFFDRLWFDQTLAARGLSRVDLAASVGFSGEELSLIYKDQMEVTPLHVSTWAAVLGETHSEIAKRCGVSTPHLCAPTIDQRIAILEARVAHLEAQIESLLRQQDAKL